MNLNGSNISLSSSYRSRNLHDLIDSVTSGRQIPCNGHGIQAVADRCNDFLICNQGTGVVQSCGSGTVFHKFGFDF